MAVRGGSNVVCIYILIYCLDFVQEIDKLDAINGGHV